MTVSQVLWLIGAILMGISAFVEPPRVSLYKLAWTCFILGFVFLGGEIVTD